MNNNQNMNLNTQASAPNDLERDAIMSIQRYLRQISFHDDEIPTVPLDGIYENATRESVIAFQTSRGLPSTGIVDRETWESLKEEYDRSVALNSPPVRLDVFPRMPQGYALGTGEESYLAAIVQHMLDELEAVYKFPSLSDSGIYDDITAANVREFQARNLIKVTGEVDRETWDALALQYNLLDNYSV